MFCENSKKLINVHLFALAARHYSLPNLGVCTPLEDILEALRGDSQGASGIFTFIFQFLFSHYRICRAFVPEGGFVCFFFCFVLFLHAFPSYMFLNFKSHLLDNFFIAIFYKVASRA